MTKLLNRYSRLVLPVLCTLLIYVPGPLWKNIEFKSYDFRIRLCRPLPLAQSRPSGKVVMVGIDDMAALKRKPFVFWYPDIGRFLKLMAQYHAAVIGIDIIPYHSLEQKLGESFVGIEGPPPDAGKLGEIGRRLDNSLV